MKKIILSAVAVLAFGFANAQETKFGVKAGVDNMSISGGGGSITGFFAGATVDFSLGDKLGLQPGVNYVSGTKSGVKFNFISVPVLFNYAIADEFKLIAGPSLYYNTDSEAADTTTFTIDLGASYDLTENLYIEARYAIGLTGDAKINHLLAGVGYRF